jgi:hypothetical protein
MYSLLAFIGVFICPRFTLGCVLVHFDHPVLGVISIVLSIIVDKK